MFNFFKKEKEYISCEWLEYGINLGANGIYHCCQFSVSNKNDAPVSALDSNKEYNIKDFLKQKRKARKQHRKGIINERCKGCFELKKKNWDSNFKITNLVIGGNTKCSASCIYCYTSFNKKIYNRQKDIPVIGVLNSLISEKLISHDCEVAFNNGEPVIMNGFDEIINILTDYKIRRIRVHSSALQYSKAVEKALEQGICDLVISPDSGNRELYRKIKNIDMFDICWGNIAKYAKSQKNQTQVQLKYIIIPGVNDKSENIAEFIEKVKESGVTHILIDIEMWWYRNNSENKDRIKEVFELVGYAESYIKQNDLTWNESIILCSAIDKYPELYKKQ